jgi:hypothetical protein
MPSALDTNVAKHVFYAECHYAECRYAECCYAECHGATYYFDLDDCAHYVMDEQ